MSSNEESLANNEKFTFKHVDVVNTKIQKHRTNKVLIKTFKAKKVLGKRSPVSKTPNGSNAAVKALRASQS